MAGKKSDLGWKVIAALSTVVAGIAARKAVELVWSKAVGQAPPDNPESPEIALREAVAFAVASGVAVGLARTLTTRQMAKAWQRALGELPGALRPDDD
ncbi:MAG: DUF4235 domain-containing protein [Streptosporangiales bacterium]